MPAVLLGDGVAEPAEAGDGVPERGVVTVLGLVPFEAPLARDLGIITLKEREPSPAATGLMSLIKGSWDKSGQ